MTEVLESIQQSWNDKLNNNKKIAKILKAVQGENAVYPDVEELSYEIGQELANTYKEYFPQLLKDGYMPEDIAREILESTLKSDYDIVSDAAVDVQTVLNTKAGIGLNAVRPEYDIDRVEGLIKYLIENEYLNIELSFLESVVNYSQHTVDQSISDNAEFHKNAGFQPIIVRKLVGGACEFCKQRAGTWDYSDDMSNFVFERHLNCKCTIQYIPSKQKIVLIRNYKKGKKKKQ
jgi:hypothetical protein